MPKPTTVDEYLAGFPDEVRPFLDRVRAIIHEQVPGATEAIAYDMPAFLLDGRRFLHFAGWKKHVGLYPVYVQDAEYETLVAPYRSGKDTVQFRYARPLPEDVLRRIVVAQRDRT